MLEEVKEFDLVYLLVLSYRTSKHSTLHSAVHHLLKGISIWNREL